MERYRLEEVTAGLEDSCLWVTLGFSSPLDAGDVLHIVCATTANPRDRELGMADLYLERFGQQYSCYGGADRITVTRASVLIRLNPKGREALGFEGEEVRFDVPTELADHAKVFHILQQMTAFEYARKLVVDLSA